MGTRLVIVYINHCQIANLLKMLTRQDFTLTISQKLTKVIQVDLALDDSFVVLASSRQDEAIMHYSSKSQLLNFYHYPLGHVNMISMLNSAEVLVPLPCSGELITIDLRNGTISGIKYDFMRRNFDSLQIFTFYESKIVCIKETNYQSITQQSMNGPGKRRLRLRYLSFPFLGDSEVISYESQEMYHHGFGSMNKANNHSLVVWFDKQNTNNFFEVFTSELVLEKGKLKNRVQRVRVNAFTDMHSLTMLDIDVFWQVRGSRGNGRKEGKRLLALDIYSGILQPNYYYLYKIDLQEGTIKACLLDFEGSHPHCIYLLNQYAVIYRRQTSYNFEQKQVGLREAITFISNHSQQLSENIQIDDVNLREVFLSGNANRLIELIPNKSIPNTFGVVVRQVIEHRQMYLQMLLWLNEDFDDDLLSDAMELLGCLNIEEDHETQ